MGRNLIKNFPTEGNLLENQETNSEREILQIGTPAHTDIKLSEIRTYFGEEL